MALGELPQPLHSTAFSLATARSVGVSRDRVRHRSIAHPGRALYVGPEAERHWLTLATGWLQLLPGGTALCGPSGLAAYDVPVRRWYPIHVLVPPAASRPRSRSGLVVHQAGAPTPVTQLGAIPVVDVAWCWWQWAGSASRDDLVVAGDSILSRKLATRDDLHQVVEAVRGQRGSAAARATLPVLRDRVDSAPESLVRLRVLDDGLPEPSVNPDLFDEAGGWIGRPDLAFEAYQVALQYEGDVHRSDPRRWRSDIGRDEVLQDHGWEVIRITAADLKDPEQLCRRIRTRLQRQAERLGLPMPF